MTDAADRSGGEASSMQATAVFVSIAGLTAMDGPTAHAAISALHRVLRDALVTPKRIRGLRVLSCLTGAILLLPDDANVEVTDLFAGAAPAIAGAGLPVHAGIAHGHVELLDDADGTRNAVGMCLNVAARLAYAEANAGLLVHASYADHIAGVLPGAHWLHPRKRSLVTVPGKRQETFQSFAAPPGAIEIRMDCSIDPADLPPFVNAVLLAYDLPKFSEGDARQLASRFRSVVQEVRRMRDTGAIPEAARFSFSPGGDGAVLALANFHPSLAHDMADRLERLLEVETLLKAEGAGVHARIGVHYGPVFLYESAEGTWRPTGTTLFDADALAGDDDAKKHDAVIVSGALIELAAHGSRAYQRERFEEIAPLCREHGLMIKRFVRRSPTQAASVASPRPSPQETATRNPPVVGDVRSTMPSALYDVFLAHVTADRDAAEQLFDLLAPEVRVWLDTRSLLLGDEWAVEIPRAQRAALATVILCSRRADNAYYLRDEIHTAIALHRAIPAEHRAVAVFLDGRPADPMQVPYGLRGLHGLDAAEDGGLAGVARKLREIVMTLRSRGVAGVAPADPPSPPARGPSPPDGQTLYDRLCKLTLGAQIEAVILRAGLPREHIAPLMAPVAQRAIDITQLALQGGPAMVERVAAAIAKEAPWLATR